MPNLWSLAPILALGTFPDPGLYCFMINPAGQVIDMGQLCGIPEIQQPVPAIPDPVTGGNALVAGSLSVAMDRGAWRVAGTVQSQVPSGITIQSVQFDLLDSSGNVVYQGSIVPPGFERLVPPRGSRNIRTRVRPGQVAGIPSSAVVTEIRYGR
jgi:hypothetical protein